MSIKFESNAKGVISAIDKGKLQGLTAACELVVAQAKMLTPVQTGQLRDSMTYEVDPTQGIVGSPLDYSEAIEMGTVHKKAQPFLRPAFRENRQNIIDLLGSNIRTEVGGD